MKHPKILASALMLAAGLASTPSYATTYILSSAPRGSRASETADYAPLARYLSQVTGQKIVYQYPQNWLTYAHNMQQNRYDILFDGPHFVSWRIQHLNAVPLVKLPQPHIWLVLRKAGDHTLTSISSLAGHTVCAPAPPNFGALVLESMFPNPLEQPFIVQTKGWKAGYDGVLAGQCEATIVPDTNYKRFDPDGSHERILFQHAPYPNQAITASARIPVAMRQQMRAALLSSQGETVLAALRKRYAKDKEFVPAHRAEYAGIDQILKGVWGF